MTSVSQSLELRYVEVDGLRIAYREVGSGPAVLLVHGWPTSSLLWRDVMPHLADNRVVAIDLPGFGSSAKPLDQRYDATFFEHVIDGFLAALGIDRVAIVVHDLGGPVGMHWALRNPGRVTGIGILNTLLYPEFSPAVIEFVQRLMTPGEREKLVSPEGVEDILRFGVRDPERLDAALLAEFAAPFVAGDAQEALARAGIGFSIKQFQAIGAALPTIAVPVRVIYGRQDRVLPDIASTVDRLLADVPQAEVTILDDCAHFIQLEAPERIGPLLAEFLAGLDTG
jgi:pimeloyl-ACP methyl ester carboxylesterase